MRCEKPWRALWFTGSVVLWLALAPGAAAQTQDSPGQIDPGIPFEKQLPSVAIDKLLDEHRIDTKEFQEPLPFKKVLERLHAQLPAAAKSLRFVIDIDSFPVNANEPSV